MACFKDEAQSFVGNGVKPPRNILIDNALLELCHTVVREDNINRGELPAEDVFLQPDSKASSRPSLSSLSFRGEGSVRDYYIRRVESRSLIEAFYS